jgi:hypothetical protein
MKKLKNSINQNFYLKFRFKLVKFSYFVTTSLNIAAPSWPIPLMPKNL